jgi:hypothetical protein
LSIETTTGMSAPPMAITRWMPSSPATSAQASSGSSGDGSTPT